MLDMRPDSSLARRAEKLVAQRLDELPQLVRHDQGGLATIGTPPSLTTAAAVLRRQGTGPFILQ